MIKKTSLIAGSTGFLGSKILNHLYKEDQKIYCLSRRKNEINSINIEDIIIDFDAINNLSLPKIDHVYLCLGHELRAWELMSMPDREKGPFYKVDYEYTLSIAKKAEEVGATSISLVSAVGANQNSKSFYLKTKGDLEEEIKKLRFKTINIFQPGHLAGRINWQRKKSEPRLDVFAFEIGSLFFDPFLVSGLQKFRSINADKLANFIVKSTINESLGINQFQYSDF
ncbi:MAG: hypothetical protein CML89_02250 [Rhodobiaceae bacterium]|nr:hypothetical protein [Rhodobiaceae bacterium]